MSLYIKSVPQMMDIIGNEVVSGTVANAGSYVGLDNNKQLVLTDLPPIDPGRQELNTTPDPVALYNFDGNLDDSSATGADLTKGGGNNLFYPNFLLSGSQSAYFDGSTCYFAPEDDALEITGDLTLLVITNVSANPSDYVSLVTHGGVNDAEAENHLYGLYLNSNEELYWFQEKDAGTNLDYTLTGYPIPLDQWVMIGATRTSNVIQFWLNGAKLGSSTSLAAPTGGGDGQLFIGSENPGTQYLYTGHIKSVKIIASALTEAQMMEEFEQVTGDLKFL